MAFHALLCVRDEVDIIKECLDHLLEWADHVHVYETGSIDGTWELIQQFSEKDPRVQIRTREAVWFNDAANRAWLFHVSRKHMREGDWIARVDADEFYHEAPPDFVRERLRGRESSVYYQLYDFCLTTGDMEMADRSAPVVDRLRWYRVDSYAEPRLFRYRDTMSWPSVASFPRNAGYLSRARIPIRHYPHRSPEQMARKCAIRSFMMSNEKNRGVWKHADLHHWSTTEWRKNVVPSGDPGLTYWQYGSNLPYDGSTAHIAGVLKRSVQKAVYNGIGIQLADWFNRKRNIVGRPDLLSLDELNELHQRIRFSDGNADFMGSHQ